MKYIYQRLSIKRNRKGFSLKNRLECHSHDLILFLKLCIYIYIYVITGALTKIIERKQFFTFQMFELILIINFFLTSVEFISEIR